MAEKVVQLERALAPEGHVGSFGFSILGGVGTKFPAVVCEVDPAGPADDSGKVQVGDQLLQLNGEDLIGLTPKELVQRVRTAPSPSIFVLAEVEDLRHQVLALLRKQERKAARQRAGAISGSNLHGADRRGHPKVTGSTPSISSEDGERRMRKKKHHEKIIEVEPSVNVNEGWSGDIVQVKRNKVVGRIEVDPTPSSEQSSKSPYKSPQPHHHESLPSPSLQPAHKDHAHSKQKTSVNSEDSLHARHGSSASVSTGRSRSPVISSGSTGGGSPRGRSGSGSPHIGGLSLEQRTALPSIADKQASPKISPKNGSVDSASIRSTGSSLGSPPREPPHQTSVVGREVNGHARNVSDSSGLYSLSETTSLSSYEEKLRATKGSDLGAKLAVATSTVAASVDQESDMSSERMENARVPRWSGGHSCTEDSSELFRPRGSLPEHVLVTELERQSSIKEAAKEHCSSPPPPSPTTKHTFIPEAQREHLMRKYRITPSRSPSRKHRDTYADAVTLARRMFMLDGFKKSEIAEKLADVSEFGQTVAKEYLKCFEFDGKTLDEAIRLFLANFSLTGESQERERVMVHFSEQYHENNPGAFLSADTVHGLTIALLLLNTDLHNDHGGHKMSSSQFVSNLARIGVKLPKDMLKKLYDSIKRRPLVWATDNDGMTVNPIDGEGEGYLTSENEDEEIVRTYHVTIPGTFVEVELPGNAQMFKEGPILKKNVMEGPHKKVPRGKRQWKACYAHLKGFLLYLVPLRGEVHLEDTSSAITITHCLAMRAYDYHKRGAVVRVTTSDWHAFLLQANVHGLCQPVDVELWKAFLTQVLPSCTPNVTDMQQWMGAINKAAARYSSPPLAAPVSSTTGFQKPTFPLAPTRNNEAQQIESHEAKIKSLEKELQEHQAYKPTGKNAKHGQLQDWFDKFEFLQFEMNRFRIYFASLTSDTIVDFNAPLPSGLVPSPSISTLANPGGSEEGLFEEYRFRGGTPPQSPSDVRLSDHKYSHSPLLDAKHARGRYS